MDYIALAAWLVTAGFGLAVLVVWMRRRAGRIPVRLVGVHVGAGVIGLGLWLGFLVSDRLLLAWSAFAVLNVANALGDAILTGRWRVLAGVGSSWLGDYGRAVLSVVKGERPANATLHALFAGVTYFVTLAACLVATF